MTCHRAVKARRLRRAFSASPPAGRPRALAGLLLAASVAAGCAGVRAPEREPAPAAEAGPAARLAAEALREAEDLYREGEYGAAAARADSLFRAWRSERALDRLADRALWLEARAREELGELGTARERLETLLERRPESPVRLEAVRRLARLRSVTGDDAGAAAVLLENPDAVEDEERALLRSATLALSLPELEELADRFPPEGPGATVIHAALARALALADRLEEARRVAERVLAASPEPPEERVARAVLEVGGVADADTFRLGAVLPLTGRFAGVGELLREGMEIALAEFREEGADVPAVSLEVLDDGSDPERAVELARRLEEGGAHAILGPVRSESFGAVARARRNPRLLIVSPTATDILAPAPYVYTLWERERWERDAARALGEWVIAEVGLRTAGVLYPPTPAGRAAAEAFAVGVEAEGGRVVSRSDYPPDSTTFEASISRVADAEPDVVFVAGDDAPTVLQIAPQLHYFGLDHSLVAGGPTWADPAVVRRLDPFAANYRVVGTYMDRIAEGTPWARFRSRYEAETRKPLRNNMLPALGHDAMKLVLEAVRAARLPLPGALSVELASGPEVTGATGILRPEPGTSTVARRTHIRVLRDGQLRVPDVTALLAWLETARVRADSVSQARADSIARADSLSGAGTSEDGPP